MNNLEIGRLLVQISAVDNRQIDEAKVEMWTRICGDIDFKDAEQAVVLAFRDMKPGEYLEPQTLRMFVKRIREERAVQLEQDNRRALEAEVVYAPAPRCREHDVRIDMCVPCRGLISQRGKDVPGADLHSWAVANVYA